MDAVKKVPFLDVRATYLELRGELDAAVGRVLESGWYIGGEEVTAFEAELAAYTGVAHGVGVATGLDALALALRALGVGPGDEVVVPSNTFIATWLAVSQCGATPVPVEPAPTSCVIDAEAVARALTPRTRAVIPVHLYGHLADVRRIREAVEGRGVAIVEDAAQAHGATHEGAPPGTFSDAAAWSFYPGKNLGAFGDAGAVTTQRRDLADRVRLLRNYGSTTKYVHEVAGTNSRLDPIQAAVLRVKLRHLDAWNARRRAVVEVYRERLAGVAGLEVFDALPGTVPSWHLFVVRHRERDGFRARLADAGVETVIHYPTPPHAQGAYRDGFVGASFPVAEAQAREVLSLPMGPHLSLEDARHVADAVLACR